MIRKLLMLAIAASLIWVSGLFIMEQRLNKSLNTLPISQIKQIAAFTLEGCGSCSRALTEIKAIEQQYPAFEFMYYSITDNTDEVNQYSVKSHPTLLFLDGNGQELDRLETEFVKGDITKKLDYLSTSSVKPIQKADAQIPRGSVLHTLYAQDIHSQAYVAVSQYEEKSTQVQYPRISALKILFSLNHLPHELTSLIPEKITFVGIDSEGTDTLVQVSESFEAIADTTQGLRVREAIALTLGEFKGVEDVRVVTKHYRSELIKPQELLTKVHPRLDYVVDPSDKHPLIVGVAQYNMAILHGNELSAIPCFCGCGAAGHTSNLNCYFSLESDGMLKRTNHAENCKVCLDITILYSEGKRNGDDLKEIRNTVDYAYKGAKGTDTPFPV